VTYDRDQPLDEQSVREAWESTLGTLLDEHALIWLADRSGRRVFPAFQFDHDGPMKPLVAAFWTVAEVVNPWTAAAWCVSPMSQLGDVSPVQWCREGGDPEILRTAAHRDAARLAQ